MEVGVLGLKGLIKIEVYEKTVEVVFILGLRYGEELLLEIRYLELYVYFIRYNRYKYGV